MRACRIAAVSLILTALIAGMGYAQDAGATVTFTGTETRIYQGTGEMREMMPLPITVGNFRILDVRLPAESNRDNVGLVIPFRGAMNEHMVNLDPRWGGARPLVLVCEAIDPSMPIGFRVRGHARAREVHSPGTWLALELGRGPKDDRPIPASDYNARFNGDTHTWYVLSSLPEIYRREDPQSTRFTIMLDTYERGSWWIKWLEIKEWPTILAE